MPWKRVHTTTAKSQAQEWAQKRNWLLRRVKSIESILYQVQTHYPDAATRSNLQDITAALVRLHERVQRINTYEKYQKYMKE
jgi:hypothetical protein